MLGEFSDRFPNHTFRLCLSEFVAGNGVPDSPLDLPNLHWLLCDKPEMAISSALLCTSDWFSSISNNND